MLNGLDLTMDLTVELGQHHYRVVVDEARSIAIPLEFDGAQPNHFGVDPARRKPIELGSFVGSTMRGGSCNVDALHLIPHCNGTHTETVGHIVDDLVPLSETLQDLFVLATLLTLEPVAASDTQDAYRPALDAADQVITADCLEQALAPALAFCEGAVSTDALVIRTLPNSADKKTALYGATNQPPFLTTDAMELVVEKGYQHLLVDFPSVDRIYDEGLLTNHHVYWGVAEDSHQLDPTSARDRTITEMIYVDDELQDGVYVLNLQTPAFSVDAAPSRPFLIPLKRV